MTRQAALGPALKKIMELQNAKSPMFSEEVYRQLFDHSGVDLLTFGDLRASRSAGFVVGRAPIPLPSDTKIFMRLILEPLRLLTAIPDVKEQWGLPEMDLNDPGVEDDRQLLRSMMAGEEQGFVDLYQKYQGPVFRFALHICGMRHVAEEVTQDTILSLIRAPRNYQSDRGPLLLY